MADPAAADFADPATTRRGRALVLACTCLAGPVPGTAGHTALSIILPLMARDLDTGIAGLQWTAECYVLVMAGCLLISGTLDDRCGRKPVFLAGPCSPLARQ